MLVGGGKGDGQSFGHREPVFAEIDGQRIPIVDLASCDSRLADKPISEFRIIRIRRLEEGMLVQAEEKQELTGRNLVRWSLINSPPIHKWCSRKSKNGTDQPQESEPRRRNNGAFLHCRETGASLNLGWSGATTVPKTVKA
jgi:hypothetical protein